MQTPINRTLIFLPIIFLMGHFSIAQTVSVKRINFRTTTELQKDSAIFTVTNSSSNPIQFRPKVDYPFLEHTPFTISDTLFELPAFGSKVLKVYFAPKQNVNHFGTVYLINNGEEGIPSVLLQGVGSFSNPYYASTANLMDEPLKAALKTKISDMNGLSYNAARDNMFMTIDNKRVNGGFAAQNTLECVYTGRQAVGYTSRSNAQTNNQFNTEHTFPQSLFNSSTPMLADIFHLFPTDERANGSRGNYAFGNPTQPYKDVAINQPSILGNNNLYSPRDVHKGVVARAMFYFVTRYQDYNSFCRPQEATLRQWHEQFQPNAQEQARNRAINQVQNNRNPFIDYPQFSKRIVSITQQQNRPTILSAEVSATSIDLGEIAIMSSRNYYVTLRNTGNADINLRNISATAGVVLGSNRDTIIKPLGCYMFELTVSPTGLGPDLGQLTFATNISGLNQVTIPIRGNVQTSLPSAISTLKLESIKLKNNPIDHSLEIENISTWGGMFVIRDATGKLILNGNTSESFQEGKLTFGNYPSGLYFLEISTQNKRGLARFIKN